MSASQPSAGVIEVALEKILASQALRSSPRLRRFLAYVVRQSLVGDDDVLKEYTLGVEVFDRGARFAPRADAIVRVEALKLRKRLHEYYRTQGATDLVTISLPSGAYRPAFHVHEDPPAAILDDPEALCCQAESLVLRATPEGVARAQRYLQRAIERWPARPELHVMLAAGAEQTISMTKYEVTWRGGKGRELLQRGQFTPVIYPLPEAPQPFEG